MIDVVKEQINLCVGCNRCVRECPMETANITYQDESGNIKVRIDHERCITCGLCISACKHEARTFADDTQRFFDDLAKGTAISIIVAPSVKTNLPEYKKLFTFLKKLGVNKIYDVSLGADICIWAHVRYIKECGRSGEMSGGALPMITQPCPAIVTYCELYRHDLLKRLSPIHSPMACISIYMKEYQNINDRIAAFSPCMAKANEFESTKLADYNITFSKLFEYLNKNNIMFPDEETDFDHGESGYESGLGSLFPMPGGFKENIEYLMGKNLHVAKAEGFNVYQKLNKYAETPQEFLPDIYDVLSCSEGCNIGTASLHDRCLFEIDKTMRTIGKQAMDERKKEHYQSIYNAYDDMLDLKCFIRNYNAAPSQSSLLTNEDIGKAFEVLGKTNYEKQHIDCFACGSKTCHDMARKIALNINIPGNCIVKAMEDARMEHEENLIAHAQLMEMEKKREADERVRAIIDAAAKENELQLVKLNLALNAGNIGLWSMDVVSDDPVNIANEIDWSDEFRHMLGYNDVNDFPNVISSIINSLHPEDLEWPTKALSDHILDKTGKTPFNAEYRMIKKNGECIYVHAYGKTIRDENGNPIRAAGAIVDITETKNLINEAERQRTEAETANKTKSEFLSHISHEIRTPMNAVLGTAEIQLQKDTNTPDINEAFNMIYNSGNLLLNIINDILDLSKIEAGRLEIAAEQYDIPSIIYDTVQLNLLRYDSKPINFNLKIDKDTPLDMIGDELRIKQILNNILSNAFKYTDEGSVELSVDAETADDTARCVLILCVSDTGQGMTEAQIERLFDEYARFNKDINRSIVGTGLGMHIAKRLIDAMNGEVSVKSEPGKGTEFTVRLPQERVGSSVCGPELADKLRSSRFKNMIKLNRAQIVHEYMPYGNVLIVDDVESNLYVAKGMMLPYGMTIETVSNGFDAVDKIKNGNEYDIIFMDHMMPKMNGLEATKIIRDMGYTKSIVALTANAITGMSAMFLDNGFDGFISKPIDIRELNTTLNRLIRDKQSPETIEAARKKMTQQKTGVMMIKDKQIRNDFLEVIVQDIEKTLAVLDNLLPKINDCSDEDMNLFITTVHGIKNVLLNIGETDLSAAAFKMEQAGNAGRLIEISADTPPFMSALRLVIEKHKPKAIANVNDISNDNMIFLKEKLSEIKTACERIQKRAAKAALDDLRSKTWPFNITVLLDEISRGLLHGEYKKIISIVEEAMK